MATYSFMDVNATLTGVGGVVNLATVRPWQKKALPLPSTKTETT